MGWRIALLVGWIAALVGLVAIPDEQGLVYIVGGIAVTVAVGAAIDRWWVGFVPIGVTVVLVGGIFLLIGGCDKDCGGDDGFWAIVLWFLAVFTVPATVALLAGVAVRRTVLRRSTVERMGGGALLWRIAVTVAWAAAIVGLALLDPDQATWYVVLGLPLTVLAGSVVNRWWVLLAPLVVTILATAISLVAEANCTGDCGETTPWQETFFVLGVLFTLPATAALAIGVGLRRIRRVDRGLPPGNQHA